MSVNGISGLTSTDAYSGSTDLEDAFSQALDALAQALAQIMSQLKANIAESMNQTDSTATAMPDSTTTDSAAADDMDSDSTADGSGGSTDMPANLQDIWSKYGSYIKKSVDDANANGAKLTYQYVAAEIMKESGGDVNAVGDNGNSIGLLQINSNNAAYTSGEYAGGDRNDPATNIAMAVSSMAEYSKEYNGDLRATADAYETGGNPNSPYLENGRDYGDIVLSIMKGGE